MVHVKVRLVVIYVVDVLFILCITNELSWIFMFEIRSEHNIDDIFMQFFAILDICVNFEYKLII